MGQAEHYDEIVTDYERHYYDSASMAYRRRYLYTNMFAGMDLNGKRVAELACGTGTNTLEVLKQFPEAEIIGLDICYRLDVYFPRLQIAANFYGKRTYIAPKQKTDTLSNKGCGGLR